MADGRARGGFTLIEMMVVVAVIGVMVQISIWGLTSFAEEQRVKSVARSIGDTFNLARGLAIRTGNSHLVVFQGALGATGAVEIANDGTPAAANCTVNGGETTYQIASLADVIWGTSGAGIPQAPGDPGLAASNIVNGSSFTDATRLAANPSNAIVFQPDGLPRLFTQNAGACTTIGLPAQGGGAIYVSGQNRDYAIVLSNLGTARVHVWESGNAAWSQ